MTFPALTELQARFTELRIPGAAIAVVHGDQRHSAAFGVTSVENPLPVTPDTLFQIGSVSKTFLATLVMRLVEQGKLNLDVPVRTWVPELVLRDAPTAARVTLRHLLTHTAGWVGDWFNNHGEGDDAVARMVAEMATLAQLTPAGQHWSYNNVGFAPAARAIERASGQTFEQAMQTHVFDPLGLKHSYFFANDVITHRFAVGHNVLPDVVQVARPWPLYRSSHPPGGIVSSVNELLTYAAAHWQDGLLSQASRTEMQRAHIPSTGLFQQGLGWWLGELEDGSPYIEHGGATNGQIALLSIVPAHKLAIAVLTNAGAGRQFTGFAMDTITRALLGSGLRSTPAVASAAPASLAEYCGRYEARLNDWLVSEQDGALSISGRALGHFPLADSPPPPPPLDVVPATALAFYAPDRCISASDPRLGSRAEFVRDAQGKIAWLRIGGRMSRRVD